MNTQNALATRQNTAVANPESANPFAAYGAAATQNRLVGDMLKFSKGEYLAGQDGREIALGTRLVANMDQLLVGWILWDDNKPIDQIMGLVGEGYVPPRRTELGQDNKDEWPTDDDGRPQDPWQLSNYLVLKDPSDGELYTFVTASTGGRGAIGELCKIYGKEMRQRPDEYPIIELAAGKYKHSNAKFGWVKFPKFDVVGWAPKSIFAGDGPAEDDGQGSLLEEATPEQVAAAAGVASAGTKKTGKPAAATRF